MEGLSLLVFFILSLMTTSALLGLLIFAPSRGDPGVRFFLYPLLPLFCVSLMVFFVIIGRSCPDLERGAVFFWKASSFLRLGLGLGWVLFCHKQYVLNGIYDRSKNLTPFFILLTVINCLFYLAVNVLFPEFRNAGNAVSSVIMSLTAIYAAILAVLILRKKNRLLPSAWAGLILAIVGLTLYPLVFVADALDYHYPGLDPDLPLWIVFLPWYLFTICFILIPKLFWTKPEKTCVADTTTTSCSSLQSVTDFLSDRETETVLLLAEGLSYKEIAEQMNVSLATVQTYVLRSYKKLSIHTRKQLNELINEDFPKKTV